MKQLPLLDVLTSGCDERIFLKDNSNKYHLNPLRFERVLQRGSCTCNPLTPDGYEVAKAFHDEMPTADFQKLLASYTGRLQETLQRDRTEEFHVVYGPSGSDAMYIPLLFQQLLNPGKTIVNIVTCPEELGSGSKVAAQNKYYAAWSQYGESLPIDEFIEGAAPVETHFLPARDVSGHIPDRKQEIRDLIEKAGDKPIVGNLVFGSKSGIKDDLAVIDEFPEIMWVVDMCQFRADLSLIHDLITKGVQIMITGSKFYQAPPFCGALLVPKDITAKVAQCDAAPAEAYARLFTRYDFPPALTNLRNVMPDFENWGLLMRWAIAVDEMEKYRGWDAEKTNAWIRRWSRVVAGRLAMSNMFEMMPDMELTNDSIISFTIHINGRALNKAELKAMFDELVTEEHEGLGHANMFFMGQPVDYGKKAFIRLAIGSYTVRQGLSADDFDFGPDLRVVELIENKVRTLYA